MTHYSSDAVDAKGVVRTGYDYNIQAWVAGYIVEKCGHRAPTDGCAACSWYGEDIRNIPGHERRETREATMQITKKDIFCVLEGRAQKRLLKLLIPGLPVAIAATITMAVLLPDTWQAMLIMIAVLVVILARPVHRWWKAMDALKEEAKKLHQDLYQDFISGHLDLQISQPDQPRATEQTQPD